MSRRIWEQHGIPNESDYDRAGMPGREVLSWTLFDIQRCGPDIEYVDFFMHSLGTLDQRKIRMTKGRTNMLVSGAIPSNEFFIQAIRLEPLPGAVSVRERERITGSVYCHGYLEFFIGSKLYHQCAPLGNYMGFGYPISPVFLIVPNQHFHVGLGWDESLRLRRPIDIAVYLDGAYMRSR